MKALCLPALALATLLGGCVEGDYAGGGKGGGGYYGGGGGYYGGGYRAPAPRYPVYGGWGARAPVQQHNWGGGGYRPSAPAQQHYAPQRPAPQQQQHQRRDWHR